MRGAVLKLSLRFLDQGQLLRPLPVKERIDIPPIFDRASVLIPLFQVDGEWRVLLTVRSKHLRSHSGLVAFPGGKQDSVDMDDIETALREADEEVGLDPGSVEIVSVLHPSYVRPNILVTVVVGIIPSDFKQTICLATNNQESHIYHCNHKFVFRNSETE
jgi:8-oxo-dGTP pyrophosphatase MutT (NUDIX family)